MVTLSSGSIKATRDTGTTIPISRCRTLPSDLRRPDLYAILVKIFDFEVLTERTYRHQPSGSKLIQTMPVYATRMTIGKVFLDHIIKIERPSGRSIYICMCQNYFCSFLASAFFVTSNMIGVAMKIEA